MVTHLLRVLSGSSFLRRCSLSVIGPRASLSATLTLLSDLLRLSAHTLSLSLSHCFYQLQLYSMVRNFLCECVSQCVCLPVCAVESSPGPGRQSCPPRCGMLLWNPHRWRCCLDWASTGDTSPTNTETQKHKHKHKYTIYNIFSVSKRRSGKSRW